MLQIAWQPGASWEVQRNWNCWVPHSTELVTHYSAAPGSLWTTIPSHSLTPSEFHLFTKSLDPLRNTWLANSLHQMVMWSMLSLHGYRHFIPVPLIPGCKHWYCSWTCLNFSGDRVGVWCVPSAAYVPCIFWHQNNFPSIIVLIQDLIQQIANL